MSKTTEETQQAKRDLEYAISELIYKFIKDNPGYDVSLSTSCVRENVQYEPDKLIAVTVKSTLTVL